MDNHFVESHSGGYYFSSDDPITIQGVGEDQGNGDNILFTFDDENLEEPVKSMGEYLTKNLIFTRDGLIDKLYYFHVEEIGVYAAITEVKCNAIYDVDTSKDILRILLEENKIDKEMYDKLIMFLNDRLNKQLEFIKGIDKISLVMNIYKKKTKKKEN